MALPLRVMIPTMLYLAVLLCPVDCSEEEQVPVIINRRFNNDIVTYASRAAHLSNLSSNRITCDNDTYLVNERRCINNQDILKECSFAIAPDQENLNPTVLLYLTSEYSNPQTTDTAQLTSDAVVITNNPLSSCCEQVVNSSFCYISSLEVYRGSEDVFRIQHDGFSLSENGTLQVGQLAYSIEELRGELYRMNLSCTSEEFTQNGCLFFKVWGRANISCAKFNNSVPGTLQRLDSDITTRSTTDTLSTLIFTDTVSNSDILYENISMPTFDDVTSTNYSVEFIIYFTLAVGGVVIFVFVTIVLCIVCVYCAVANKTIKSTTCRILDSQENENVPPAHLFCEQSDFISVIPLTVPERQTVRAKGNNNRGGQNPLVFPNGSSLDVFPDPSHCKYESNPAYLTRKQ